MNEDTKLQRLLHVLRLCGAAMIVAAAGTFLVQSWDETGDVKRYLALLGTTALLPAVAYICGVRFREGRSARVLVLTVLALMPIHAGVLGGFVLSQFGTVGTSLGPVAQWVAPNRTAAILLVLGAFSVLLPMVWGAFRVLVRPHAHLLTATSAGAHALMWVPDRSSMAAILTVIPILGAAGWCATHTKPDTREAKLGVGFLVAPAAVIAARQVLFYDVSLAFWAAVFGVCAIGLFVLGKRVGDVTIERLALVPTLLSVAALVDDVTHHFSMKLPWDTLSYGWVTGAVLLAMAWRSARSTKFFVLSAMTINAVVAAFALMLDSSPWTALQLVAVGIGLASYGFIAGRRASLLFGVGFAGVGFIAEVAYAIDAFEPGGWLALGGSGAVLVGLTAWLERRARAVRRAEPPAKLSQPARATLPG